MGVVEGAAVKVGGSAATTHTFWCCNTHILVLQHTQFGATTHTFWCHTGATHKHTHTLVLQHTHPGAAHTGVAKYTH